MPSFVRSNVTAAVVFLVALVASWLVLARLAGADVDAGQMVPAPASIEPLDAGSYRTPAVVVDRVVAADHAGPASVDPGAYQPAPAPPGMSAETLTWDYIKAGGGASLAMRLIFWIGTALLASQEWLARRWPKIATGRNLAIVSSVVGAMLTLGRGAALSGGAMTWLALAEAVMSAVLLVTRPEPKNVAGQTVPA
ncbi:MAG: hypothetical protein VW547_18280 [Alphaproteobacteria bacterium]